MKKSAILIAAAALCLPCFKGYANSFKDGGRSAGGSELSVGNGLNAEYELINEDYPGSRVPLIGEGDNYYIRPAENDENTFVVMLPLSSVLYEYADISWDAGQGRVNVTCGTLDVSMEIGSTSYTINGEIAELDAPPEVIDGITYVPSTFFERTFGFWITSGGEGVIDLFIPSFIIENI